MSSDSLLDDESLASRCRGGDEAAWSALVSRHAPTVFRLARRSVRRDDEAEDLVQDVFWKAARAMDRYDASRPFRPWLLQVARRHLIDHHRSRRVEKESTVSLELLPTPPASTAPNQVAHVLRAERAAAIAAGLERLPAVLAEAVVLRDLEGLEYEEIAGALGIPVGTVKSRINRGRVQLAEGLRALEEDLA